ncbi:cupin domain-containing protein [Pelagibius sp. Alg239-R121]|uniref:cupin domain-containing protein n=1 Tax=Pelagibius sp. Alg239-R121 TaxID=2993448 RepID=UPI0024A65813|nr:cupin domain-containing protein [Pelagibius sp. Alg239-R121]
MDATFQNSARRLIGCAVMVLGFFSLTACSAQADSAFDAKKEVALPGWQLAYENINPMIKMAVAYGNRAEGAHGSFGKFPPNFTTPFHTHSGAYHGVVLKGVMTNPFAGEEAPAKMSSGSYWYVPANSKHATACISDEPCEFYFYADSAFDFHVVE